MIWLILAIGVIAVVEIYLLLPFKNNLSDLKLFSSKAIKTIAAKNISDHWKQKVILIYAALLFKSSVFLFLFLVATFFPLVILGMLGDVINVDLFGVLATPTGLIVSTVNFIAYVLIRRKLVNSG